LVEDRMARMWLRWTVPGAPAVLHLRATYMNDPWDDFIEEPIEREQNWLYKKDAAWC